MRIIKFGGIVNMSKKLAIKGHSTRGKEVIKLLEMLGGTPAECVKGFMDLNYYYISEDTATKYIYWKYIGPKEIDKYEIFTLDEFYAKYPYKVGDFVSIPEYESEVRICEMEWDGFEIQYKVYRNDDEEWYTAVELLEYNDNPTHHLDTDCCVSLDDVYSISKCNTIGQGTYVIKIADGYKFDRINENGNIIVKSIKPTYPTTYKECCVVLGMPPYYNLRYHTYEPNYDEYATINSLLSLENKLNIFGKLLICCKAYWKIAGEESGLGKPWEPNWCDVKQLKFGIHTVENQIRRITLHVLKNLILVFPTEEIRDVFYENFKDLIEQCKELL